MSTKKHSAKPASVEELFEKAIEAIPYPDLQPTGCTQGDIEAEENGSIEYSEEYTFTAGTLLDEPLEAGGWIELRCDDGETNISAFFGVARHGNWQDKDAQVLPEYHAIQGQYDFEKQSWEFWIDAY